jgi:hypothetical protein
VARGEAPLGAEPAARGVLVHAQVLAEVDAAAVAELIVVDPELALERRQENAEHHGELLLAGLHHRLRDGAEARRAD